MSARKLWAPLAAALVFLALSAPGVTQTQNNDQSAERKAKPESAAKKTAKKATEAAAAANLPPVLARELSDVPTLDVYDGIGGKEGAPDPDATYTFISEDLSQTQPKFDVRDPQGRRWRIKVGVEAQPETAATRLVWAAGYYVDEDYYLDTVKVKGLPKLHRGEKFVEAGGVVRGARLKLMPKKQKNIGYWKWPDNPFVNTTDFNGLRVMMALINNWDLVTRNNKVYEVDGQRRYVVSDLGASFGRSGNEFTRKKGDLDAYAHSQFIVKATPEVVAFSDHSRPLPPAFLAPPVASIPRHYYSSLAHGEQVVKNIPPADVKAIAQRLAQLSEDQIRDCFRAAGYSPEEVDGYTKVVRDRIAQLNAL